jgi:hypothetical protein
MLLFCLVSNWVFPVMILIGLKQHPWHRGEHRDEGTPPDWLTKSIAYGQGEDHNRKSHHQP